MTDTHRSEAKVATAQARGYLQQLCKHFAHKLPVSFDAGQGRIEFAMGACEAASEPEALRLRASADSAADLAMVEDVMARHLVRFAFREELRVAWSPAQD